MKKERVDKLAKQIEELDVKRNNIESQLNKLYTDDIKKFLEDFNNKQSNIEKCNKISDEINDWYNNNFVDEDDEIGIKTDLENASELAKNFTNELKQQKQEIQDIKTNFENNNNRLEEKNKTIKEDSEETKNDLIKWKEQAKDWLDEAVGASVFKCFKETANEYTNKEQSHYRTSIKAMIGEIVFLMAYACYLVYKDKFEWHNLIISVPIAIAFGFIWWTAKQKSNQYAKLKEEYRHKATSMESFVGYRKQFKEQLTDEEYKELFKNTVVVNLTRNPSDELDKILLQKDPVHKITDLLSDLSKGSLSKIIDCFTSLQDSFYKIGDMLCKIGKNKE